jgi:uncharacterized membrane protein
MTAARAGARQEPTMTSATPDSRGRLESIDLLRGVVMILMALDHTRDYFGIPGQNPTDLAAVDTTAALFLTRWVTSFCAPVFFLLTGTGAFLSLGRKSIPELSRFLFVRGLWLIFLEVVVMRCLAYQFNFDYRVTMLIVLWALGWSMITLSLLVRLPTAIVAIFGLVLIAGHNLLDSVQSTKLAFIILHSPGFIFQSPRHVVFVAYPLVPWIGVTAVGYGLAHVYRWPAARRRALLWRAGAALTLAFILARALNRYGDPLPWSSQRTPLFTVLSFLDTNKYPPSLQFLLMTLGPALLFLAACDSVTPRLLRPALTLGKVPLFYYIVHFCLIHLVAVAFCLIGNGAAHWMFESPDLAHYPFTPPPHWGFALPIVYAVWIGVVVSVLPLCRWFAALKQRRHDWWLSYL